MAQGGMRISEVLNLTASDVEDRKLIIRDAKSGKAVEHVFIPQKIADRLKKNPSGSGLHFSLALKFCQE